MGSSVVRKLSQEDCLNLWTQGGGAKIPVLWTFFKCLSYGRSLLLTAECRIACWIVEAMCAELPTRLEEHLCNLCLGSCSRLWVHHGRRRQPGCQFSVKKRAQKRAQKGPKKGPQMEAKWIFEKGTCLNSQFITSKRVMTLKPCVQQRLTNQDRPPLMRHKLICFSAIDILLK